MKNSQTKKKFEPDPNSPIPKRLQTKAFTNNQPTSEE